MKIMKIMIVIIIGCWIAVAVIGIKSLSKSYSVKIEKKTDVAEPAKSTANSGLTLQDVTDNENTGDNFSGGAGSESTYQKTAPLFVVGYELGAKYTEGANSTVIGYKEKHIKLGEY